MCQNQLVRNTGPYQSFSIIGIALTLAIGGVIMLIGSTIDVTIGHFQKNRKSEYRRQQWILEDRLQLQRMAYEGYGVGGKWEGRLSSIPTIVRSDKQQESETLIGSSSELYDVQETRESIIRPDLKKGHGGGMFQNR
ncbi:hypothetical protein GP486_005920 [Trichoglossum hirsutum]|uniref:Uncharacterized protein n=1 Tax=Trichoglossum hirsutum TaxID=265104 RepID=A0A9P8L8A2_9PEZI|nr:hypothetical protein GP486_005920 [Trichoglossum hirsutum]